MFPSVMNKYETGLSWNKLTDALVFGDFFPIISNCYFENLFSVKIVGVFEVCLIVN